MATIPGCERLAATGDNSYEMTVTAGVAAIKGTYLGSCALSDLKQHESLVMRLPGAGAPGTIDATVRVELREAEPGAPRIDYEADAVVGGMVGGVGQRMLDSVSKRMAGEFFGNVAQAIAGSRSGGRAGRGLRGAAPAPTVFSAPSRRPASAPRTTSSRASPSGPAWCCSAWSRSVFGRRR